MNDFKIDLIVHGWWSRLNAGARAVSSPRQMRLLRRWTSLNTMKKFFLELRAWLRGGENDLYKK